MCSRAGTIQTCTPGHLVLRPVPRACLSLPQSLASLWGELAVSGAELILLLRSSQGQLAVLDFTELHFLA